MRQDLFREEALSYQSASNSRFGKPTGVLPPSWGVITLLLSIFIGALIVFLFTVDFARKETVRGKLRVDGAEARIYPLETGLITHVRAQNGDRVAAGTPLFEITKERYMHDGATLSAATLEQIELEAQSLQRRKQAIAKAADLAAEQAAHRVRDARRQENEFGEQLKVVRERLAIARNRAQDARSFLAEGLIVEAQLNERLDTLARLEQSTLQTEAQFHAARAEQDRAELDRRQTLANKERDLADIDQRLNQIASQRQRTEAETTHIVTAPIGGRLTALQARAGEQASPTLPLAIILPEDSVLIAEVYLPSRAIGFIEPGQSVKLQYDAFPYQKFGVAFGEISQIAETAQRPQEIGLPSQTGEPVYQVQIALKSQHIEAFSKDMPLQAGMELTADIVLENRRLLEWLLEPLRS